MYRYKLIYRINTKIRRRLHSSGSDLKFWFKVPTEYCVPFIRTEKSGTVYEANNGIIHNYWSLIN